MIVPMFGRLYFAHLFNSKILTDEDDGDGRMIDA